MPRLSLFGFRWRFFNEPFIILSNPPALTLCLSSKAAFILFFFHTF